MVVILQWQARFQPLKEREKVSHGASNPNQYKARHSVANLLYSKRAKMIRDMKLMIYICVTNCTLGQGGEGREGGMGSCYCSRADNLACFAYLNKMLTTGILSHDLGRCDIETDLLQ